MKLSHSWEAPHKLCICSRSPNIWWTLNIHLLFARCLQWSQYLARSAQFIAPQYMSLISIIILSTYLHLGFFHSGFPMNNLYAFILYPICATSHVHPTLLDLIILSKEYKSWSISLRNFLHPLATSFLFSRNIHLLPLHLDSVQIFSSASFSNTLSLCS